MKLTTLSLALANQRAAFNEKIVASSSRRSPVSFPSRRSVRDAIDVKQTRRQIGSASLLAATYLHRSSIQILEVTTSLSKVRSRKIARFGVGGGGLPASGRAGTEGSRVIQEAKADQVQATKEGLAPGLV